MTAIDILRDAADRPREAAQRLREQLTPEVLAAHPGGHDNSVAWLLWHTAREIDVQVAQLAGGPERWETGDHARRTGLGAAGGGIGYGHDAQAARAIVVPEAGPLLDYLEDATDALQGYLASLREADLDQVIDEDWDPPVTRGTRLVSIIDDAAQHIGQAAYVVGMPDRG